MPEKNEKVEDFISLWRKKMETEIDKPSAIMETLEKIKEVEKENEELRNKIKDNIELISKTEKMVKSTIEENERLKEQVKQEGTSGGINISDLQKENINLNTFFDETDFQNLVKKGLKFSIIKTPNIEICADKNKLKQILINLEVMQINLQIKEVL